MWKWQRVGELLIGSVLIDAAVYVLLWLWEKKTASSSKAKSLENGSMPVTVLPEKRKPFFHKVVFFPEEKLPCRFYYEGIKNGYGGCVKTDCSYSHDAPLLEHLISTMSKARKSLDVCVYLITCNELCSAIQYVHSRGVTVRIITDGNFADDSKSKIGALRAKGIPVRCNKPGFPMHHKFVIMDDKILSNGSFNWTWQAITGNNENVLTTDDVAVVQPYIDEFNRLWKLFELYHG